MSLTARCYCGHTQLYLKATAQTVAYCHCSDCKRWTGAPMPAFAAFDVNELTIIPPTPEKSFAQGVQRRNCAKCGSPLTARFDYLPDQVYVPVGIFEDATDMHPEIHCYITRALPWVHTDDGIPKADDSASDTLLKARDD